MATPKPTVGRIVHYMPRDWETRGTELRAAIVASVCDDETTCNLTVFEPGGEVRPEHNVPQDEDEHAAHSWSWPSRKD